MSNYDFTLVIFLNMRIIWFSLANWLLRTDQEVVTTEIKRQESVCDDFGFGLAARKHVRVCYIADMYIRSTNTKI